MSTLGTVLRERYELIAEIGQGGMSRVFLAKDLHLDSYWAVKLVQNDSSVKFAAFRKEVELLASLNYSDIPRIVDRIEVGDAYYVVMDFVDGSSLGKKVLNSGAQAESDVVEWGRQLCDALDYLHHVRDNPIVYCDMKPDNVMLNQAGRVKLIDFGIAKECKRGKKYEGESVGTKGFASPEQYSGASNMLDERSDIYSLGATLFYLATGVMPKAPPDGVPLARRVNPAVSEGLEYVIAKSTAQDPAQRYQSVAEMRADLDNVEHLSSEYRATMRRKLGRFIGCVAAAMIFAVVSVLGLQSMRFEKEDRFQTAFQAATAFERNGEMARAAEEYSIAIGHKPDDLDTHFYFLNALLPQSGDPDYIAKTRSAIDEMRKRYVENEQSPMYHNPALMFRLTQLCLQVEDPAYARYAETYISLLVAQPGNTEARERQLEVYGIMASYLAQDVGNQDFGQFTEALAELEEITDTSEMSVDERLENYYLIVKMYATYPNDLADSNESIYRVAHKAKALIDSLADAEDSEFRMIVPLYEMVAAAQYNYAGVTTDVPQREQSYRRCIEWFGYLEDLEVRLSEAMAIKKANAHRRIFDLSNYQGSANVNVAELDLAIVEYRKVVAEYPDSFLGHLALTQALLDRELQRPEGQRNYQLVLEAYARVLAIKNSRNNLSSAELSQFGALKRQLILAGLVVES